MEIKLEQCWMHEGDIWLEAYVEGNEIDEIFQSYIKQEHFEAFVKANYDLSSYEYEDEDYCELGYTFKYKGVYFKEWFENLYSKDQDEIVLNFINNGSNLHEVILQDLRKPKTNFIDPTSSKEIEDWYEANFSKVIKSIN